MSDIAANASLQGGSEPREAPVTTTGPIGWMRANLFSGWLSTAVTLLLAYVIVRALIGVVDWAFINAVWSVPIGPNGAAQTQACR
jgi:general L-amino acid transport system permease protein